MRKFLWLIPLFLFSCAHRPKSLEAQFERSSSANETRESNQTFDASCHPLSQDDRLRLLEIADPSNFPATRYRRGPSSKRGIESETDCSHFVHEVYRRAGLPYAFRSTRDLRYAEEFDLLPEAEALPGDLMLFRGHVGIVDNEGKIISALRTRRRARKSSISTTDRELFRGFRGRRYVLRYRCLPRQQAARDMTSEQSLP